MLLFGIQTSMKTCSIPTCSQSFFNFLISNEVLEIQTSYHPDGPRSSTRHKFHEANGIRRS